MIFVFKTSVKNKSQIRKLKPYLDKIARRAIWNFDLHDCDKILRIDSEENIVLPVINLLKTHDFICKELE